MFDCFLILAELVVFRFLVAEPLSGKYTQLSEAIPYLNYACIGAAALFAVFVLIAVIRKIIRG